MTRFLKHLRSLAATVLTGGLALIIAGSSAQTTPTNATVDLSLGPIATSAQAVNVALALSVEFPTVGAAYRTPDYSHTTVYLGYFDATGCYAYKDNSAGAPIGGQYFYRTGNVDASGYCDNASSGAGKYSGNLLNYVTTSSIDLLRYALTGGNRVVDTADTTILERAYLYNNWNLHNGTYFPAKRIPAALVGKVTPTMTKPTGEAVTGDVIAGGCWDRVYFGTSSTSVGCANAETTTSGNLNPRAPGGSIQTGRVPVGTPIPSTAIGAVTTTVSWEVSNPLVTSTVAPTNGGPTNDTFTYYVAIPGETLTPAPTGSGLSNAHGQPVVHPRDRGAHDGNRPRAHLHLPDPGGRTQPQRAGLHHGHPRHWHYRYQRHPRHGDHHQRTAGHYQQRHNAGLQGLCLRHCA